MKKCTVCGQDVYVTPNDREFSLCATHALQKLALLLYPRKAKAILARQAKPKPTEPKTEKP